MEPRRKIAGPVTKDEKAQRKQRLETALGVEDVSQLLDQLRTSANVMYVIDKKATYSDVQ